MKILKTKAIKFYALLLFSACYLHAANAQIAVYWHGAGAAVPTYSTVTDLTAVTEATSGWTTTAAAGGTRVVVGSGNDLNIVFAAAGTAQQILKLNANLVCNSLTMTTDGATVSGNEWVDIATNGFNMNVADGISITNNAGGITDMDNGFFIRLLVQNSGSNNSAVTCGSFSAHNTTTGSGLSTSDITLDIGGGSAGSSLTCNGNFTWINNMTPDPTVSTILYSDVINVSGTLNISGTTTVYTTAITAGALPYVTAFSTDNGGTINLNGSASIGGTSGGPNRVSMNSRTYTNRTIGHYVGAGVQSATTGIVNFGNNLTCEVNARTQSGSLPASFNFWGGTSAAPAVITMNTTSLIFPATTIGATSAPAYYSLTGNNISVQSGSGFIENGSSVLDAGIVTIKSLGGSSAFTLNNTSALLLKGANNFPANFTTYMLNNTSTVTYSGALQQTIKTNITYGNLIFNNTSGGLTYT